jgi:hypothetical protein
MKDIIADMVESLLVVPQGKQLSDKSFRDEKSEMSVRISVMDWHKGNDKDNVSSWDLCL